MNNTLSLESGGGTCLSECLGVHGAGGAPRQAQVLSVGRAMAARPILPALPAGRIAIPAGSMFDTQYLGL